MSTKKKKKKVEVKEEQKEEIKEQKEEVEKVMVRFLKDVPSEFVGVDGKVYPAFTKEDVAFIPKLNAEAFVKQGDAEILSIKERDEDIPQRERLDKLYKVIMRFTREYGYARCEEIYDSLGKAYHSYVEDDLKVLEKEGKIYRYKDGWRYVG